MGIKDDIYARARAEHISKLVEQREQRRYELAKAAMQGWIANTEGRPEPETCRQCAEDSLQYADALLKALEGKPNG